MTEVSDPQANLVRADGRTADELRPVTFERDFTAMSAGSCPDCGRGIAPSDPPRPTEVK